MDGIFIQSRSYVIGGSALGPGEVIVNTPSVQSPEPLSWFTTMTNLAPA